MPKRPQRRAVKKTQPVERRPEPADGSLRPSLSPLDAGGRGQRVPSVKRCEVPDLDTTLCAAGIAAEIAGADHFASSLLRLPFAPQDLAGLDLGTVRMFRWDPRARSYQPVWNSGINRQLGFVWAKITRPGVYVPIGLPRDRLLYTVLARLAAGRHRYDDAEAEEIAGLAARTFEPLLALPKDALSLLRHTAAKLEITTSIEPPEPYELRRIEGGHVACFPFPRDMTIDDLQRRITRLRSRSRALPEEALFFPPDAVPPGALPWEPGSRIPEWRGAWLDDLPVLRPPFHRIDLYWPWFFSKDWWMYQHDEEHAGAASGMSNITSTTAHRLHRIWKTPVAGEVLSKPAIVEGKVYIGTMVTSGNDTATMYKIDLHSGAVEGTFSLTGPFHYSIHGIGGTPAVTDGRVYFTTVYGLVACLDAATMTLIWCTDLKHADQAKNQPVNNPEGDSWSGPMVANGNVWIGSGEGEPKSPTIGPAWGFVWCLDANDGRVRWLYCTNKFVDPNNPGNENEPNHIPLSTAAWWAAGAGFTLQPDPLHRGASVWSSCAYDWELDRIYVCTGNSVEDNPLPDERYASGLISLDASSGAFRGFFQPAPSDAYDPRDKDVDVPCGPTLYAIGDTRVVAFGSKNGSFFVLDADTLAVRARRQLLARIGGTGLPGNYGTADTSSIDGVVPFGTSPADQENKWGVLGTAGLHRDLERIFIGLGGYMGVSGFTKTPFMRAIRWDTLQDAWPTAVGSDNIARYTVATPPLYQTDEAGLASPAVVNDVVFMSTHKPALYAFDAASGVLLWSATGLPPRGWATYALGPAIYGNYVVMGTNHEIHCWRLRFWPLDVVFKPPYWPIDIPPPVPVPPFPRPEPPRVRVPPRPDPGPLGPGVAPRARGKTPARRRAAKKRR